MKLTSVELSIVALATSELPDLRAAGCLALAGSVTAAGLMSRTGDCSVGIGAGVGAVDVGEMELPTLESLASRVAGRLALAPSVRGAGLVSRTEDCCVGIVARAGVEDFGEKVLKAELTGTTGLGL